MSRLRLTLEILGVALYLAAHWGVAWIYILGSPLGDVAPVPYWAAIGGGYVALLGIAVFRPWHLRPLRRRQVLDRWLVTFPPVLVLSIALVIWRWPLEFRGWDGHGMGADGGEANALFLPWLHAGLLLLSGRFPRASVQSVTSTP